MLSFSPPLCRSIAAPLLTTPAEAQAPKRASAIEAFLPATARDAAGSLSPSADRSKRKIRIYESGAIGESDDGKHEGDEERL